MEVTHLDQFDTHAVIGGAKAQAFRMAETAEFFTVLSDTLYSNKKLAVVREVICNAWDAHIKTGKTDTPVRITLDEKELIIEDQGPGIPEDAIVDIYCTYGKSTKVEDEDQTGGFGLGSKAPFAYTAHFTVTNRHRGFRTVYAISRGSTQTGGKPDIRQMVRVPDEMTGVTVTIPIVNPSDFSEFRMLIKKVVSNGEIKATLNNEELETIDLSLARKIGFTLAHGGMLPKYSLRYGSVIYPIDMDHQDLRAHRINTFGGANVRFIFVAAPNSVGVTPSRESLSYTDRTIETIKELLNNAERYLNNFTSREYILKNDRAFDKLNFTDIFNLSDNRSFYSIVEGFICTSNQDISDFMVCAGKFTVNSEHRIIARLKGALSQKCDQKTATNKGQIRKLLRLMMQKNNLVYSEKGYNPKYRQVLKYATEKSFWKRNRKIIDALYPFREHLDHMVLRTDGSDYYGKCPTVYRLDMIDLVRFLERRKFTEMLCVKSKAEYERWFQMTMFEEHVNWAAKMNSKRPMDSHEFRSYRAQKLRNTLIIQTPKGASKETSQIASILGITNIHHVSIEKKQVQVETKLYEATGASFEKDGDGSMRFNTKDKSRSSEKFTLMIPCRAPKASEASVYPDHRHKRINWIIDYFNAKGYKVGVVITAHEKALALKNGIRPLNEEILSELERIKKSSRILTLIALGNMHVEYEDWGDRDRASRISDWLKTSGEFRRLALPSIPKLNEEEERLYGLWDAVTSNASYDVNNVIGPVKLEIYGLAQKQSKAKEIKSSLRFNRFARDFPGIRHLTGDMTPELMTILKTLRKFGAKMDKGEKTNG